MFVCQNREVSVLSRPITNSRAGTCPHGCPQGACPICNGMGSGMQTKKTEATKPREMSWSECYAEWQKILAKQAEKRPQRDTFSTGNNIFNNNNKILSVISEKIMQFGNNIWNKTPAPIKKVLNGANKMLINPAKNLFKFIFSKEIFQRNFIKETFINIADKLAAIFGEEELIKNKKILNSMKNLPKKLFKLFGLYDVDDEQEEDKVFEEEKRISEIKDTQEAILHIDGKEGIESDENKSIQKS